MSGVLHSCFWNGCQCPSSCLDDYLQEVGRIGRSTDKQSNALLLTYSGCTRSKNITNGMKEYVRNTDVCRCSLLMEPFLDWQDKPDEETRMECHSCCDICAKTCRCLCLCKGKYTCDNVCNSELFFFSAMEAISDSTSVMMIEQCSPDEGTDDSDINIRRRIFS